MAPDEHTPTLTPKHAAIFAGVYAVLGLCALLFMTLSYGRPPVTALIPVILIPFCIFIGVIVTASRK